VADKQTIEAYQALPEWELAKMIWGLGILKIKSRSRDLIFSHGQVTKSKSRKLQINNYVSQIQLLAT
jgi:hypothetical protein